MDIDKIKGKFINFSCSYAGVYGIVNLKNDKFYIGSSKNVYKRKIRHISDLNRNKHQNPHLQNAYNKDKNYFIFVMLEKVEDIDLLVETEQKWIDNLKAYDRTIGYNILLKAYSPKGYKWTEEQLEKVIGTRGKSVYQYNKKGDLIKFWDTVANCARELNLKRQMIYSACNGRKNTYNGFIWSYEELNISYFDKFIKKPKVVKEKMSRKGISYHTEESRRKIGEASKNRIRSKETNKKISESNKGKKHTEESKKKISDGTFKIPIYQLDLDGNIIKEWTCANEIRLKLGFDSGKIGKCCKGERKTHKGFKWIYKSDYDLRNPINNIK